MATDVTWVVEQPASTKAPSNATAIAVDFMRHLKHRPARWHIPWLWD